MAARKSWPVRKLTDEDARPPRKREVVTGTEHALAFWLGGTYDRARPDHGDGALLTATFGVIRHYAPADAVPVFIHYERAEPVPWRVENGQSYAQMWQAIEAAAGEVV
jgi:hypothetical protein